MSRPRKIDYDKARAMRAEGMSMSFIARELGCAHQAVSSACDEEKRLHRIKTAKVRTGRNRESYLASQRRYNQKRSQSNKVQALA